MKFLVDLLSQIKPSRDDNAIDRTHYVYTCWLLVLFSLLIGGFQFGGKPMVCWTPAQFHDSWSEYVVDYCFVENTFFLAWHDPLPPYQKVDRKQREISYYQWVPFILAFQAFLFYLPHLFWSLLNWQSGLNVRKIVTTATDTKNLDAENRERNMKMLAKHIEQSLQFQKDYGIRGNPISWILRFGKSKGIYVAITYIAVKVLQAVNIVCQFFMLNSFLSPQYSWWGFDIARDLFNGREWQVSGHFPRTTYCDLEVRVLGHNHRYTIQCVLWINMLNEKIFLFLWWWFFVVAIVTMIDLLYWICMVIAPNQNIAFICSYLRIRKQIDSSNRKSVQKFVTSLRPDGIFVLRLMASNCGELLATDIVEQLWRNFKYPQLEQQQKDEPVGSNRVSSTSGSDISADKDSTPLITKTASMALNGKGDGTSFAPPLYVSIEKDASRM